MGLFRPITRLGRSVVFLSKKKSKSSKTREKQIESGKVLLFWIQIHIRLLLSYEQTDREREREGTMAYVSVLLYGLGGIVVAGVALLVVFQEKLVYVPVLPGLTKSYPITPARLNLIYEDVWLRSSDGVRLHSWFIKMLPGCQGFILLLI